MALASAHEGYEYQDLLTAYFILNEILHEREAEFVIDRKEYESDNIDDLLIINPERKFKKQIKYSNEDSNHVLSKADLAADGGYNLSIDSLYFAWFNHHATDTTDFRICLSWQEPVDELINILEKVEGNRTFPNYSTKVFKIDGQKLWPENSLPLSSWRRFRKESVNINRASFLEFCKCLKIEVLMPKISLDLAMPGALERIVIDQVKDLGIGTFPNAHLQPETFILSLLAIIKRSRSKGTSIASSSIFHDLNIRTDYGSIEQSFPVIESENIKRATVLEEFVNEIKDNSKVLLTGEPGSGKSWFIDNLLNHLKSKKTAVIRHYCYTDLNDSLQRERIKLNVFYGNLISDILKYYPNLKKIKKQRFASNLSELNHLLENIKEPLFIIIDGLDHIERIANFRGFNDISIQDRGIIESLESVAVNPLVKIIVSSQNIPQLSLIQSFNKKIVPSWTENDIKKYLKKSNIQNKMLKRGISTSRFLSQKSNGNPLYLKYLTDEIKELPAVTYQSLSLLPEYSFNLSNYYCYLLSQLKLREEVPQILSGVSFSLTKTELEEITYVGDFVEESIQILSPVLKINLSQSGYSIYHESFRRFIIEHLKSKSIPIEQKIFRPIIEWFDSKSFYGYQKSYRYYLQFLSEGGSYEKVLSLLDKRFITDSILNGQSWKLIEKNYNLFVNSACITNNFPCVVLLNELNKIISSCQSQFKEIYPIYLKAMGRIQGFEYLSSYLVYENSKTIPYSYGLEACYLCDENNVVAPWEIYMEYFKKGKKVNLDNFKYFIRGLLVFKDVERLCEIGKRIRKDKDQFCSEFVNELKNYPNQDFIGSLNENCNEIEILIKYAEFENHNYTVEEVRNMATIILKMDNVFEKEEEEIKRFFSAVKKLTAEEDLLNELISLFKGKNWFYNWLIYFIKIIKTKSNPNFKYEEVKEAFDFLTYKTAPFEGQPRTCDLYCLQPYIYQSFCEGLRLLDSKKQWEEVIKILVLVSNSTTTSLQRSISGPLATDKLFQILTDNISSENIDFIITVLENQVNDKAEYHLHTNVAEYNLLLASIYALHEDKSDAKYYFEKGIEFSLAYTMRKDLTLMDMIDGLEDYSRLNPAKALENLRKAKILIDSAVSHTDGRETNHFPNLWFEKFIQIDLRTASQYLLNELKSYTYSWSDETSLVNLLCSSGGNIDPEIEAFLTLTFPLEDSEKFVVYCLNLYEKLISMNSPLAQKVMSRIIPAMQPAHNRQRSNETITKYNECVAEESLKAPIKSENLQNSEPDFAPWYVKISDRPRFSMMSIDELLSYFENNNINDEDLNSLAFFLDEYEDLSETLKELIQLIVFKNNKKLYQKANLDATFRTGNDIECYYWICRFIGDSGGWFQKFVNEDAFIQAHSLNPNNALVFLFELLPSQLQTNFNFSFSSNLIKLLISINYENAVIEKCWQNVVDVTSNRLPSQTEFEWDETFSSDMNIQEIFCSILLCRLKAETSDRYKVVILALDLNFMQNPDAWIKPFQWFLHNRKEFSNIAFIIVLQYINKKNSTDNQYCLIFKEELVKIYPSKYFLIDYIISDLYNISPSKIYEQKGLTYPSIPEKIFKFMYYLNYKFEIFFRNGIDLHPSFNKYAAIFPNKYRDSLEPYANRLYKKMVRHIHGSEYMMELINTDCYEELELWKLWEEQEIFKLATFIDTDAIAAHAGSCGTRPSELLLPSEFEKNRSILKMSNDEWIRIGHVETEIKKQDFRETISYRSFGGIVFSNISKKSIPYSAYRLYPFQLWNNRSLDLPLDGNIIFSIIQDDPLEFLKILWLNPSILNLLGLAVKRNGEGLYAVNERNDKILIMRTWSCNYIGGGYHSNLSDEIPTLEGTDLVIRKDYYAKLCKLFKNEPKYFVETMEGYFA